MRYFNTEGPIFAAEHYSVPPLSRLDLEGVLTLIRRKKTFVLHAPRQTGKTSALLALRDLLNGGAEGDLRCTYANLEVGEAGGEDTERCMRAILGELRDRAEESGDSAFPGDWRQLLDETGPDNALRATLTRWSRADPRPLVLLLDEVDALVGDTLLSVLRQFRAGYDRRRTDFPHSVVLCGLRDIRDYRLHPSSDNDAGSRGSPFNIRAKSLRLGDFSDAEIRSLLAQHTEETGQAFEPEAVETIREQTRGQPWLVNALAYEACFENERGRDRRRPITADDLLDAREALVSRRESHLDQLGDRLREDRVRRVIEPLLRGVSVDDSTDRDVEYVRDLGLIAPDDPVRIANPIYREVVPRQLTRRVQSKLPQETHWFVSAENRLEVPKLLERFQKYFREHAEHWIGRFDYAEAGPQLLLQAFCQRVVNGGGRVEREYGLGRKRTDLLLMWPRGDGKWDKFVVECKVLHRSREATEREGLEQTVDYMARCGAESGHLVIFDRSESRSWNEKIYRRDTERNGLPITIWGM